MKKITAIAVMFTGAALNIWWWGYTLFLPYKLIAVDYSQLINHPAWIPVNFFEVVMVISWLVFIVFYASTYL